MSDNHIAKKAAGEAAALLVDEGMCVGLGTGSTAYYFIEALGKKCREGLKITALATSRQSAHQAEKLGIPLADQSEIRFLDLTVDGADAIDPQKNMIKGGGGALLREKLLALASEEMIVVVDEAKLVKHLGKFPVPVEITPFAFHTTLKRLFDHGYQGSLRLNRDGSIYLTDNAHYIFDIQFNKPLEHPEQEHEKLKRLCGVIETGIFFNIAGRVIVGYNDGSVKMR